MPITWHFKSSNHGIGVALAGIGTGWALGMI
jgi:hypothetical protein